MATRSTRKNKSTKDSTRASQYVAEEMDDMKKGNRRIQSPKQAIAIGLSKARKAGVPVPQKSLTRSQPTSRTQTSTRSKNAQARKPAQLRGTQQRNQASRTTRAKGSRRVSARSRAA